MRSLIENFNDTAYRDSVMKREIGGSEKRDLLVKPPPTCKHSSNKLPFSPGSESLAQCHVPAGISRYILHPRAPRRQGQSNQHPCMFQ